MSNTLLLANPRDDTGEMHNQVSEDLKLVSHQRLSVVICDHVISWTVLYHDSSCWIRSVT